MQRTPFATHSFSTLSAAVFAKLARLWLLLWIAVWLPQAARAQGSMPSPLPVAAGAEALGRGGAYVAKADSLLALDYNVAGLAGLRGTNVQLEGQVWIPGDSDFPCRDYSRNQARPCAGGSAAISTDFGVLRRWTFALGFRLPEYVTGYGLRVLSGSGDDANWPRALLFAPSLAVAVRLHPRWSLGLSLEDAMALSLRPCFVVYQDGYDYGQGCSRPRVTDSSLLNPLAQLGVLGRLGGERVAVLLGASLRSSPNFGAAPIFGGSVPVDLPWTMRGGARLVVTTAGGHRADIELDGVAQIYSPYPAQDLLAVPLPRSTVGLRLGGGYEMPFRRVTLSLRAGFLFDWQLRPAMPTGYGSQDRIYILGGTFGLGIESRHVALQLGYGYLSQRFLSMSPGSDVWDGSSRLASHLVSMSLLFRFGARS
jgi:hypothetical protein